MTSFREFHDGTSRLVIDSSFVPVIIRTYYGISTEKLERESSAWLYECLSKLPSDVKIVMVADTRGVTSTDPKIRKVVAEESKKLEPQMRAHDVACIVIINSSLVRSAIVAINWISNMNLIPVKDMDDAFRLAGELLEKKGQRLPVGLTSETYRVPMTPARKSG